MRTIKGYLDEWRVQEYLLITFFISWLSWGILILLTALHIVELNSVIGMIFFGIGGFGPTISGILCIEGKLTWQKLKNFIFSHQKKSFWYLLLFVVLECLAIGLSSGEVNPNLPWFIVPAILLMCIFVGGGNEELGWRGTLQPILERITDKKIKNPTLSFIVTTLIVGLIWAVWHLPLWFVAGSTQQGINFGLFLINAVLLAFWLACVYRRTGSVFYCMILHGISNTLMSLFVIKVNWLLALGFLGITILSIILAKKPRIVSKPTKG